MLIVGARGVLQGIAAAVTESPSSCHQEAMAGGLAEGRGNLVLERGVCGQRHEPVGIEAVGIEGVAIELKVQALGPDESIRGLNTVALWSTQQQQQQHHRKESQMAQCPHD